VQLIVSSFAVAYGLFYIVDALAQATLALRIHPRCRLRRLSLKFRAWFGQSTKLRFTSPYELLFGAGLILAGAINH
jgi:hypothetical protein